MIVDLDEAHTCRYGVPVLSRVETAIFRLKYFAHCMACHFCHDWCCSHGADVDVQNGARIANRADELERFVQIPRELWFDESETCEDDEAPGKLWLRTSVVNGACVFLNRSGRGCLLHSFSMNQDLDYHELKPFVCAIFPLTYENGVLIQADEVDDRSLVCTGEGLSLYQGVRTELEFYFGKPLITELDLLQQQAISDFRFQISD